MVSPRRALLIAALWLITGAGTQAQAQPARVARVEHVVLVSLEGLRPDVALRANMKNLRALMEAGAFSFWARTTAVAVTLPSHTSMLTGVPPDEHEIEWNRDLPFSSPVYPSYPTVLELATRAGLSTAMATGKSKFSVLNKPGTIAQVFVPRKSHIDDAQVADHAVEMIANARPALLFVHLPGVDSAGHGSGWGSPAQLAAAERVDAQLGRILAALEAAGIRASTAVLLSADHGGAGLTHGADDPRSRHIPWILAGPGVRRGFDLTRNPELDIHTEDSAATICFLLGLDCGKITGVPVLAAFEKP